MFNRTLFINLMKWNFILRGQAFAHGGICTGASYDPADMMWTLQSEPHLNVGQQSSRAALLRMARRACAREGGRLVIVENGRVTHAMEWRDYGELDPEASGNFYEKKLDPADFRALF